MIGILFLCWISTQETLSQSLSWTVATSVPRFKNELKLTCTVLSSCCSSSSRIWTKKGTAILNDGTSYDSNKYVEEWDGGTTDFSLIIKNLDFEDDVNVEYDCQYSLWNDTHTLTPEDSWEYTPDEECPVSNKLAPTNDFTYKISRSAPVPSVYAFVGSKNWTSSLISTGPTNFATWFYSLEVPIDVGKVCEEDQEQAFALTVVTGTTSTEVCNNLFLCYPCWKCALKYFLIAAGASLLGFLLLWNIFCICFSLSCCSSWRIRKYFCWKYKEVIDGDNYKLYGKEYERKRARRALWRALILTLMGYALFFSIFYSSLLVGNYCPACRGVTEVSAVSFGVAGFIFLINFYVTLQVPDCQPIVWQWLHCIGVVVLADLIFPLPFLLIYYYILRDVDDNSLCKKRMRIFGLVVLAIFIIPIPFFIWYCTMKDKNLMREGETAADIKSEIKIRKDGELVPGKATTVNL